MEWKCYLIQGQGGGWHCLPGHEEKAQRQEEKIATEDLLIRKHHLLRFVQECGFFPPLKDFCSTGIAASDAAMDSLTDANIYSSAC